MKTSVASLRQLSGLIPESVADFTGMRNDVPLLDIIPLGKEFAGRFLDCSGIDLPVELGPWGTVCSMLFWGQRSNAAFGAVDLIVHYQVTRDLEYARKIYPYLLETMDFWEDYLTYEDDKYVIYDDSVHEGSDDRKNPIVSLGLIRMVAKALLHLSVALDRDADRREKWRHILDPLSPFPTYERNGQTVFRLAEEVVRLFPVWPKTRDAAFYKLRAYGAFLVSSEYKDGCVRYAVVESEKGGDCTVHIPWSAASVYCDDEPVVETDQSRLTFPTEAGRKYLLLPG